MSEPTNSDIDSGVNIESAVGEALGSKIRSEAWMAHMGLHRTALAVETTESVRLPTLYTIHDIR